MCEVTIRVAKRMRDLEGADDDRLSKEGVKKVKFASWLESKLLALDHFGLPRHAIRLLSRVSSTS